MIELGNGGGEVSRSVEVPAFFEDLDYLALGFGEFALFGEEFVAGDGFGFTFDDHVGQETGFNFVFGHFIGFASDHDVGIEGFVGGFETGGLVDGISHDGVLELFVGAHVARSDFAGVDAHAGVDVATVLGFEFAFEGLESFLLFEGRPAGFPSVGVRIGIGPDGDAEVGHNGIAGIFIDVATVLGDEIAHGGEVAVEDFGEVLGGDGFGDGGKACEIGKENGDHAFFSREAEAVGIGLHVGEDLGTDHGGKHAADSAFIPLFEDELIAEATDATEEEGEAGADGGEDEAEFILDKESEEGVSQPKKNE